MRQQSGVPAEALAAAKARTWVVIRPKLLGYLRRVGENAESWQRTNFYEFLPMIKDSASLMFRELASLRPDIDPKLLLNSVSEVVAPTPPAPPDDTAQTGPAQSAEGDLTQSPKDLWEQWIEAASREASIRSPLASPSPQLELRPFPFLQPLYRNLARRSVEEALGDLLPMVQAAFLSRLARRQDTDQSAASSSEPKVQVKPSRPAKVYKTAIGRNIDRLRNECGWSYDELVRQTGLDKKLILGHVNDGRGAHPKTLRVYADALTKGLKRRVTVEELKT